jgi:hypothetical protein
LTRIFEEKAEVFGANLCLLGEAVPVAIGSVVKGKDQVVDGFRFGGDLAKSDTSAFESSSIKYQKLACSS